MEIYKNDAREILERFLNFQLSSPDCIAALDAALARFIPRLRCEELDALKAQLIENHEIMGKELERRALGAGLRHSTIRQ